MLQVHVVFNAIFIIFQVIFRLYAKITCHNLSQTLLMIDSGPVRNMQCISSNKFEKLCSLLAFIVRENQWFCVLFTYVSCGLKQPNFMASPVLQYNTLISPCDTYVFYSGAIHGEQINYGTYCKYCAEFGLSYHEMSYIGALYS